MSRSESRLGSRPRRVGSDERAGWALQTPRLLPVVCLKPDALTIKNLEHMPEDSPVVLLHHKIPGFLFQCLKVFEILLQFEAEQRAEFGVCVLHRRVSDQAAACCTGLAV